MSDPTWLTAAQDNERAEQADHMVAMLYANHVLGNLEIISMISTELAGPRCDLVPAVVAKLLELANPVGAGEGIGDD